MTESERPTYRLINRKPVQVQRDWRLPEGCRFRIWPEYAIEYKGRGYHPSPTEAEVLLLLMSQPYRYFSARELAEIIYEDREDGGPEWADSGVKALVPEKALRDRFAVSLPRQGGKGDQLLFGTDKSRGACGYRTTIQASAEMRADRAADSAQAGANRLI